MELASRILSILLGSAVMVLLLWPVAIPLGFSEVWWASRQANAPAASEKPPPESPPTATEKTASIAPAQPPASGSEDHETAPQDRARTAAVEPEPVAPNAAAPRATTKTYRRVTVRDGGTLHAEGVVIRLGGVLAREASATCKDARGSTWRCGAAAKAALTKLIRGRAVTCALPRSGEHNIIIARCSVGGTDLSTWMLRQGWAEPKDANEAPLAEAAAAAKKERLGLWRGGG